MINIDSFRVTDLRHKFKFIKINLYELINILMSVNDIVDIFQIVNIKKNNY